MAAEERWGREGYSSGQEVWEMNRQAGMVVSESWDWSTAIKSHIEYWKRTLKKRPPGPFPVFHVTGVLDVNNLNSPGTFTCWTCLNSDGLVLFSSAETMECMAGFLLLCDVATQTQAFGKSCREEFSELGSARQRSNLHWRCFMDSGQELHKGSWDLTGPFPEVLSDYLCPERFSKRNWLWARSSLRT